VGESYLDGTAGFGGHAAEILARTQAPQNSVLVDRDESAILALGERFGDAAEIINLSFLDAARKLSEEGREFDMILLDLGVSSPQLDTPVRGFSFKADAPLDMRMDRRQALTAKDVVNGMRERELERILRDYGEEPKARAVARAIMAGRPFATTGELARAVRPAALKGDIDAATRTFQAIRIEVNNELGQLADALPLFTNLLSFGGRLAIISFHSLEDRIVKQFFDLESRDCICPPKQPVCTCGHVASLKKITSKPLTADSTETAINPRARSAKLRAAENINKNKRRD
jgi:16S rRNA (cytosine1402-N4)-methyltransferase